MRRSSGLDTLYGLNSMTKPISAFAVMLLIEQGKLSLDTQVADIFPAFAHMKVLTDPSNSMQARPAAKPITIRHLVTHTSGLAYDFNVTGQLQKLYLADNVAMWRRIAPDGSAKGPASLTAFANAAAGLPLLFEPGSLFK